MTQSIPSGPIIDHDLYNSPQVDASFCRRRRDLIFCRKRSTDQVIRNFFSIPCDLDDIPGEFVETPEVKKHEFCFDDQTSIRITTVTHPPSPLPGYHFFTVKPRGTGFHSFRDPSKISGSLTLFLPPASLACLPEASCETSTGQVFYGLDQEAFTYRVMHSVALQLSSVEVINSDGNVVSTAHLIQSHVLPRQLQVSNKEANCTLNEGERAFLVRGSKDWGICIGKWEGYVRGVPAVAPSKRSRWGTRGIPGNPGYLKIKFFSLVETNEWITSYKNNMTNFEIYFPTGTCTVDLRTGEISFPARVDHVPESIALGFVIAMLHLICQPFQPTARYNSISLNLSKPRRIDNENMKLVVAAGYYASTIRDYTSGDCSGCGGCGGCGACGSSGCGGDGGGGDGDGDDDGGYSGGGSGGGSGGCSGCSGCSMGS